MIALRSSKVPISAKWPRSPFPCPSEAPFLSGPDKTQASQRLKSLGFRNVIVRERDGYRG